MSHVRIYPVIMAGGASSRLWPASNREKPKWDLRLFGPQSLLQGAFERGRAVAEASDIFVVTGTAQAELVVRTLPDLAKDNLLIEPEPRDTAGAVAFALGGILRRIKEKGGDENGVMLILPGDHVISPVAKFADCARAGAAAASSERALVTFGIVARSPATAYGYIHRGDVIPGAAGAKLYRVREFREKPDRATAESYLASGEYFWNGGIFLWQLGVILKEMQRQLPGHAELALALRDGPSVAKVMSERFGALKKISIDFGVLEGAEKVLCVAADFDWDDIGSWSAVAAHLQRQDGNAVGPDTRVLNVASENNVVLASGKRVALVGVENLAVIESDGQILICRLDRDQDVKKISEMAQRG
ncbi:MAG TPA: sugar phosphate nucleotidyltransferase [Planctomycetota bacterium]|nr:sugar phosphate nucleotidyltransferase [Planctomycetota bacterium]